MSLLAELLLLVSEVFLELVFELGVNGFVRRSGVGRERRMSGLALLVLAVLGAVLGAVSAVALPRSILQTESARIFNLFFTPMAAGGVMALLGTLRQKRGDPRTPLETFWIGALFALTFVLARFVVLTVTRPLE